MPDIKETLIDLLTGYSLDTYEDVQYVADELIAKGVLPVVRCRDCKHFLEKGGVLEPWCDWHEASLFCGDGFCADGERKDGDG